MKVLKYNNPRDAEIIEVPAPVPGADQILSKSLYCNISAGTEMGFYRGTAPQLNYKPDGHGNFHESPDCIKYPMQANAPGVWWMGYANVSRVVEVGTAIRNIHKGDVIFSQKGHCEYQLLKEHEVLKLPGNINHEHAALLALVEIAFNGILDAELKLLSNVVVFGLGTIGQLLVQMLKKSGVNVIGVDCLAKRIETARKNGADTVVNFQEQDVLRTVYEKTGDKGADLVFEATGNIRALSEAIRVCAYNGQVIAISFYNSASDSLWLGREFHHKRVKLVSSQTCGINPCLSNIWDMPRRRQAALSLLNVLDIGSLISHRVSFLDLPDTLKIIDENPSACNAVIIKYEV